MELNKSYVYGDNKFCIKRFQAMCLIMYADSDKYSGIWNDLKNSTLLVTENYPKTTTAAYYIPCRYNKLTPTRQVHEQTASFKFVQSGNKEKKSQNQEIMVDNLQKSHAFSSSKQEIMWEISHHQQPTPALDQNCYRWDSP